MPKYEIRRPEGMPEWFTPGIVCRVRNSPDQGWQVERPIVGYSRGYLPFMDNQGGFFAFAEPVEIEEWNPKEGEFIAGWDEGNTWFIVDKYNSLTPWSHIARLVYPDGRVIDCACDVETLKARTEWR